MAENKKVTKTVDAIVKDIRANPSARFSKTDFQTLVYAILADKDFKAKKYLLRNDEFVEQEVDINGAMGKFLDKLLRHAGLENAAERAKVIDSFDYGLRDIDWVSDAVDEAMYIYSEAGKNMKVFRDKMLQLAIQKMERSGKYAGKVTYKKTVIDRLNQLNKRREHKEG